MIETCLDCGVRIGELHDLFCTKERCPFCGGQLISCDCIRNVLKLSEEESKSGCAPTDLAALVADLRSQSHLRLLGLMTMPPWSEEAELSRPYFRRLRELAAEHGLKHLSMGMSHDLEVAIEEGATEVRIGTALFGPRVKP